MTIRKIDLMHRRFGKCEGHVCKECSNLTSHMYDKKYYKCRVYGESYSEATDWRVSYPACGMFNKEWKGGRIVELVRSGSEFNRKRAEEPIEGQICFMEY